MRSYDISEVARNERFKQPEAKKSGTLASSCFRLFHIFIRKIIDQLCHENTLDNSRLLLVSAAKKKCLDLRWGMDFMESIGDFLVLHLTI